MVFGPLDISEYDRTFPDPEFIADEFEDALRLIESVLGSGCEEVLRLEKLVQSLRELPSDFLKLMRAIQMRRLLSTLSLNF